MIQPTSPAYKSARSLQRAVKKVHDALPRSPRKRKEVYKKLIFLSNENETKENSSQKHHSHALSEEVKQKVVEFYLKDTTSRQLPGRKDSKKCLDKNTGQKCTMQKRLMMFTLKEAYHLFCENEGSSDLIGLSKFSSLCPEWVQHINSNKNEVCCCPYCENLSKLLKKVHHETFDTTSVKNLISSIVCDHRNEECMREKCEDCKVKTSVLLDTVTFITSDESTNGEESRITVLVDQWTEGKLVEQSWDVIEARNVLSKQLTKMKEHHYNITTQAQALQKQKDQLDTDTVIMQTDFAENFAIKHQNEVMAAHWVNDPASSVTIYTAVLYYRQSNDPHVLRSQCYAVISDAPRHTTSEAKAFNKAILEDFTSNNPIKKIIAWTDGAAAHFKNRFMMTTMPDDTYLSGIEYESWNFFESYHGKGAHDGVGATLKRFVWQHILSGRKVVKNQRDFFKLVQDSSVNVKCLFVNNDEIHINEDKKFFETIPPIPGIHSAHCISKLGHLRIAVFRNTGEHSPQIIQKLSTGENELQGCSVDNSKRFELYVGDWCLVMYDGVIYPGEIVTVCDNGEFEVSVMVREGKYYKWPLKEDKLIYSSQDIVRKILPPTVVNNRGHFRFEDLF